MKKRLIRLTEGDLHRIIRQAINEIGDTVKYQNLLGKLAARKAFRDRDAYGAERVNDYAAKASNNAYNKETGGDNKNYYPEALANDRERRFSFGNGANDVANYYRKQRQRK